MPTSREPLSNCQVVDDSHLSRSTSSYKSESVNPATPRDFQQGGLPSGSLGISVSPRFYSGSFGIADEFVLLRISQKVRLELLRKKGPMLDSGFSLAQKVCCFTLPTFLIDLLEIRQTNCVNINPRRSGGVKWKELSQSILSST